MAVPTNITVERYSPIVTMTGVGAVTLWTTPAIPTTGEYVVKFEITVTNYPGSTDAGYIETIFVCQNTAGTATVTPATGTNSVSFLASFGGITVTAVASTNTVVFSISNTKGTNPTYARADVTAKLTAP